MPGGPTTTLHVYHPRPSVILETLAAAAPHLRVVPLETPESLRTALPEIEILFASIPPHDGWAPATRLRLLQLMGVGADMLLPSPDLPASVEVGCARGIFAAEGAEHAISAMLALTRDQLRIAEQHRAHKFRQFSSPALAGRTAVLVGLGEIGRRIARAAAALDMRVLGVSRRGQPVPDVGETFPASRLHEALPRADYLVITAPRTPATTQLIDRAAIAALPRGARLVLLARGGIVDETAVVDALASQHLAGAALDVFAEEPLPPESPLWTVPGLYITPHSAAYGERYLERCTDALLENLADLEAGRPLRRRVDREAGY